MTMNHRPPTGRFSTALAILACSLLLAACGGGGGNPGTPVGGDGGGGTPGTPPPVGTTPQDPTLKLLVVDGSGNPVTTLSGGQNATIKATVTTSAGKPAANAIVKFATGDATLIAFTPASGSALTDVNGVAVITVKPASFTAAGAVALSADSVVEAKTATASTNIAVGAAPLTIGKLAFVSPPTGVLPAFSTIALNIPVTSGGQPVSSVTGLTLSSLCVGDGTATLVPGAVANGIQTATYTNNGCLRGRDTLTASVGNSVQTISVDVGSANIGTIQFTASNLSGSSIVLKGSGGLGRSESAQLTFKVVDQHNTGLSGVDVNFSATTTTGGLSVSPAKATTDASGNVTTMVASGTIPTPVRVIAEATRNGVTISGLSDALTVSTGLPIQKSMSMSVDRYNIEGLNFDNETASVTVLMADQYGNPVSDNTTINFVTEGGAVGSSAQGACATVNGGCSVILRSQEFRPTNGRVTVLAYAQGVENFTDTNGDGQYSCTNFVDANGAVPPTYRPLVDTCVSGGEPFVDMGDAFLDAGKLNKTSGVMPDKDLLDGSYEPANGDLPFPYNHASYTSAGNGKWGLNYIRRSVEITFSGSDAILLRQMCDINGCRDWTAADGNPSLIAGVAGANCSAQALNFRLFDVNNNPMPAGTTVTGIDGDKIIPGTVGPNLIASTIAIGGTFHSVVVKPDTGCAAGSFSVKIMTPRGTGTVYSFKSS
jgi:hypothetical protein